MSAPSPKPTSSRQGDTFSWQPVPCAFGSSAHDADEQQREKTAVQAAQQTGGAAQLPEGVLQSGGRGEEEREGEVPQVPLRSGDQAVLRQNRIQLV